MNTDKANRKRRGTLLMVIVLTAVITLLVGGGIAYLGGYLGPVPAAVITGVDDHGDHDHEDGETFYTCGMHPWIITEEEGNCPICGMKLVVKRDASPSSADAGERTILYWRAPMNPMEIYDQPGKSAMGMDLVPVYEDEVIGGVEINIDPVTQQNMGVRTAAVKSGPLAHTIRTYGHITYDETRLVEVSPKFNGWIERLHVDFTGQRVEKNQPLFDVYSPELITAQEEYLLAYRKARQGGRNASAMLASVRRRLDYYDVTAKDIRKLETSGKVRKALTIRSPFAGVAIYKNAVEGGYINAGTAIYRIADLSKVWVEAHIYEYELDRVKTGQAAEMILPYLPGQIYNGKVAFIYPYMQQKTRDVVIRIEFDNPDFRLKPDMYADIRIKTVADGEGLLIPDEAVIRSGERNVVFVAKGDGKFTPREVALGIVLDDGYVQVLTGLANGETVVTSGQFLLDSESKLKEAIQKMLAAKADPGMAGNTVKTDENFFDDVEE
jgi:RND family efflux transporter MFP subunit